MWIIRLYICVVFGAILSLSVADAQTCESTDGRGRDCPSITVNKSVKNSVTDRVAHKTPAKKPCGRLEWFSDPCDTTTKPSTEQTPSPALRLRSPTDLWGLDLRGLWDCSGTSTSKCKRVRCTGNKRIASKTGMNVYRGTQTFTCRTTLKPACVLNDDLGGAQRPKTTSAKCSTVFYVTGSKAKEKITGGRGCRGAATWIFTGNNVMWSAKSNGGIITGSTTCIR